MMLRRSLLLHAYLYYSLSETIISDHEWDRRAQECYKLQQENGWNIGFYDEIFKHFEGQSGYWFPTNREGLDENIDRVARRLLKHQKDLLAMDDCVVLPSGYAFSAKWITDLQERKKELDKLS